MRTYEGDQATEWSDGLWELGKEDSIQRYVAHLVEVFCAVKRVLRDDGALVIELGDSYVGAKGSGTFDKEEEDSLSHASLSAGLDDEHANRRKPRNVHKRRSLVPSPVDELGHSNQEYKGRNFPRVESLHSASQGDHIVDATCGPLPFLAFPGALPLGAQESNNPALSVEPLDDDLYSNHQPAKTSCDQLGLDLASDDVSPSAHKKASPSSAQKDAGGLQQSAQGQYNKPDTVSTADSSVDHKEDKAYGYEPYQYHTIQYHQLQPLNLLGVPWRVALAMQEDGWILRSEVIYHHVNAMPESVGSWRWERCRIKVGPRGKGTSPKYEGSDYGWAPDSTWKNPVMAQWADCPGCPKCTPNDGYVLLRHNWRPTKSHSTVFQFIKKPGAFFDGEAVREPLSPTASYGGTYATDTKTFNRQGNIGNAGMTFLPNPAGRNMRSVLSLSSEPSKLPHFATFGIKLVKPFILASTSEAGVCPKCRAQWARVVEKQVYGREGWGPARKDHTGNLQGSQSIIRLGDGCAGSIDVQTLGWRASCRCNAGPAVPATVMDIFTGTGTTNVAAKSLGRRSIGIDLSPAYIGIAARRLERTQPGMVLG